jgi:glycosyltransferase A (GT-A) superfamily protein (DUF2064 family)
MAKAPIPGAVKTRLVPFLSIDEAAELARALLIDQLSHLKAISTADLYLAFTPQETAALMHELAPPEFALFSQTHGDLGARMQNIFANLFAKGHKYIVLIGADLPPVPLGYFTQAFIHLHGKKSPIHPPFVKGERGGFDGPQQRVVLGPSRDGGYYLIGLNRQVPEIFTDMRWSHDQVFAQTLVKLRALTVPTLELPQWFDVDTPADLKALAQDRTAPYRNQMKNTSKVLDRVKI